MPKGLSIRAFARADGCDEKLVRRKVQLGHLPALKDGSIDPKFVGTDWRRRVRTPGANSADTLEVSAGSVRTDELEPEQADEALARFMQHAVADGRQLLSKAEAERLKENYLALLRELEYDRNAAAVAPVGEISKAVAAEYAIVRARLSKIASRLAARCAAMKSAEQIKSLIDIEVRQALEELTMIGADR